MIIKSEMLHRLPPEERTQRNARIRYLYEHGTSSDALATRFSLAISTVKSIVKSCSVEECSVGRNDENDFASNRRI